MRVLHKFSNKRIEKEIENDNPKLLTTNKKGGFFLWQEEPDSRYCGFYHRSGNSVYKSIESIRLHDSSKIVMLQNNFWSFGTKREDGREEFFFTPYGFDSLVYETNKEATFDLIFDAKEIFDDDEWGRNYDFSEEDGKLVIEFSKSKDGKNSYKYYTVIKSEDFAYKIKKDWKLKDHKFDLLRRDPPFSRYVFLSVELVGSRFVFSSSHDKEKALKEADHVYSNIGKLREEYSDYVEHFSRKEGLNTKDEEINLAYLASKFSLSEMLVYDDDGKMQGLYAGLPWFTQFWARDSLLSLISLPKKEKEKLFSFYLNELEQKGELEPCNVGCIRSADSHGLFFKRAEDLFSENLLTKEEVFKLQGILKTKIEKDALKYIKDGLEVNGSKETWMDTGFQTDVRDGARIEIQALRLNMYNLAAKLTGDRKYFELETELAKKVREMFFDGELLKDGSNDRTVRPNIFLAYYIYPDLLHQHEWKKVFLNSMHDIWLLWGGFATISQYSPIFCGQHRGCLEPNQSYHRGDSWFFVNSIAAMALFKVDKEKFKDNIESILEANTKEILWSGVLGHHAELSSAEKFSSFGCLAQAWSSAMYAELIETVTNTRKK